MTESRINIDEICYFDDGESVAYNDSGTLEFAFIMSRDPLDLNIFKVKRYVVIREGVLSLGAGVYSLRKQFILHNIIVLNKAAWAEVPLVKAGLVDTFQIIGYGAEKFHNASRTHRNCNNNNNNIFRTFNSISSSTLRSWEPFMSRVRFILEFSAFLRQRNSAMQDSNMHVVVTGMNRRTLLQFVNYISVRYSLAFKYEGKETKTLMSGDPHDLECFRYQCENKRISVLLPDMLSLVGFLSLNCLRYFVPTNANPKSVLKPKNFKTSVPIHYVNDEPIAACIELLTGTLRLVTKAVIANFTDDLHVVNGNANIYDDRDNWTGFIYNMGQDVSLFEVLNRSLITSLL